MVQFRDFFHHLLKRPGGCVCPGFGESGLAKLGAAGGEDRIVGGAIYRWERCAHPLTQGVRLHRTVAAAA